MKYFILSLLFNGIQSINLLRNPVEFDDDVTLQVNGVPVLVKPESMMNLDNQMAASDLGVRGLMVGPDELRFAQKPKDLSNLMIKNPVNNPPFNNWSVNQPSVPHEKGMKGTEDLEQRDIIIDGVNYDF